MNAQKKSQSEKSLTKKYPPISWRIVNYFIGDHLQIVSTNKLNIQFDTLIEFNT